MTMKQTKYIPCTESDLRIGQVVELLLTGKFVIPGGEWVSFELDENTIQIAAKHLNYPETIRIPALSHEDILRLWGEEATMYPFYAGKVYMRGNYELVYDFEDCIAYIREFIYEDEEENRDIEPVEYHIRTPLEFRDLMRFLGIKN